MKRNQNANREKYSKDTVYSRLSVLTNKSMFLILRPQSVAAWEECIRICFIKPLQISQIHTQTNLKKTVMK